MSLSDNIVAQLIEMRIAIGDARRIIAKLDPVETEWGSLGAIHAPATKHTSCRGRSIRIGHETQLDPVLALLDPFARELYCIRHDRYTMVKFRFGNSKWRRDTKHPTHPRKLDNVHAQPTHHSLLHDPRAKLETR